MEISSPNRPGRELQNRGDKVGANAKGSEGGKAPVPEKCGNGGAFFRMDAHCSLLVISQGDWSCRIHTAKIYSFMNAKNLIIMIMIMLFRIRTRIRIRMIIRMIIECNADP